MLKTLIKKQLFESWKGIFINSKTGKVRTKKSQTWMIVLFAFCFICLAFSFFGMSMTLSPLFGSEYEWLIYATFGIMAITLCIFLNAFSANSVIYKAKDNDLLLSLPIMAKDILFSRFVGLYSLSLLYVTCIWLPVCLNGWIHGVNSVLAIILDILLVFVVSLFVTALALVVGYIFALITNFSKSKTIVTVLASVALIAVYYVTMFRIEELFGTFVTNSSAVANSISSWGIIFVWLAKGAQGNIISFLLFTLVTIALFLIIYYALSKTFIGVATRNNNVSKKGTKITYSEKGDSRTALLKKEFSHFLSSPAYMLNTGLGVFIILGITVVGAIKINDLNVVLNEMAVEIPFIYDFVPLIIVLAIMLIVSMDCISAPSISLEGKNLWILKSTPVNTFEIFYAKEQLHFLVNAIPSIISIIVLGLCLKLDYTLIVFMIATIILYIQSAAIFGLICGVLNPNFHWVNETQPIKQSLNVLFCMIYGWVICALIGLGYFLLIKKLSLASYFEIVIIALALITIVLRKWIRTKGVEKFNNL